MGWFENTFGGENAPQWMQGIANMPKYWDTAGAVSKMGDIVDIAHAPLAEDVSSLTKYGFDPFRKKPIPQLDDIFNPGRMNEGVFVGAGDEAADVAKMYGKGRAVRGTGLGATTVKPFTGQVPRDLLQFSRNMWGHLQAKVPGVAANKAFGLPNSIPYRLLSAIPKSKLTRFLGRAMPVANIGLGYLSMFDRVRRGQPLRAAAAGISMIPGPIGMGGLALEEVGDYFANKRAESAANIGGQTQVGSGDGRMGRRGIVSVPNRFAGASIGAQDAQARRGV